MSIAHTLGSSDAAPPSRPSAARGRSLVTVSGGLNRRHFLRSALAATLAAALPVASGGGSPRLRMGWSAWADAEIVTRLARQVLEEHLQQAVELVLLDIESVYRSLADGRIDVMLVSWQPHTHEHLLGLVAGKSEHLGPIYQGARLGWVVPGYVPEEQVASIGDLAKPAVRQRLRGVVHGIDPASGLMRLSQQAIVRYRLQGYALRGASGSGMGAAVAGAVERGDWVVATAWTPHWLFARYPLRFLQDPMGVLGDSESVHGLGRAGFAQDFPRAAAFLRSFQLSLADLEAMMLAATLGAPEQAVRTWLESHEDNLETWLASSARGVPS